MLSYFKVVLIQMTYLWSCCCGLVAKLCSTLVIPWAIAHQAPPSMGFPRQEYWSELPLPSPGDLPKPGIEPVSPALQADSSPVNHPESLQPVVKDSKIIKFPLTYYLSERRKVKLISK